MKNKNRAVRAESDYGFYPDYFYYVVPADLSVSALKYIEEKYPWAGLISYKEFTNNGHEYSSFEFVKRAKKQKTNNKDNELIVKDHIVARMGSIIADLLFKTKE
jgi:type III secretory pathway component EscR